jgi:ubiquinone/menaquinone biosynthesis C-methylase UbiE
MMAPMAPVDDLFGSHERRERERMTTDELPEHARRNRSAWDAWASDYATWAPDAWKGDEVTWGQFGIPDAEVGALPPSVEGLDVIELGCGTAYISAWLARRGARPIGIDNSPEQLETARRMQDRFDLHFPLHLGNAEEMPFPDASFDLAVSEYGASIWCDPYRWIPEAARVLRPGGTLAFLVNGLLLMLCTPVDATEETPVSTRLERPQFGLHRVEWPDTEAVEFHISHGDWIRVLRESGFEVVDLFEIRAPDDTERRHPHASMAWARSWPTEEIWVARRRG